MKIQFRILNVVLLVIQLMSFVLLGVITYLVAGWSFSGGPSAPYTLLLVLLLIVFLAVTAFFIGVTIRTIIFNNAVIRSKVNKLLFTVYILFCFIPILGAAMFTLALFNESPPQLFTFDDKLATYTIKKHDDIYWVEYHTKSDSNKSIGCMWDLNGKKSCGVELNQNMEVIVGKSETDLKPFINKNVIMSGDFKHEKSQCIAGKCKYLYGFVGVDIKSIRLSK